MLYLLVQSCEEHVVLLHVVDPTFQHRSYRNYVSQPPLLLGCRLRTWLHHLTHLLEADLETGHGKCQMGKEHLLNRCRWRLRREVLGGRGSRSQWAAVCCALGIVPRAAVGSLSLQLFGGDHSPRLSLNKPLSAEVPQSGICCLQLRSE